MKLRNDFEQAVTGGKAQWVISLAHDPARSSALIYLTHDIEHFRPERAIAFSEIQQWNCRWSQRDDHCVESLLGADERRDDDYRFHYLLITEQREIEIVTIRKAAIHDV